LCLRLEDFFFIAGVVIVCVIDFNSMVLGSTGRGAVYQCPNLLELMDGSTSSCVATDYHWLTYLYNDPWLYI